MRSTTSHNPFNALTAVTGVAGILFGIIVGYIAGAGQLQQPPGTVIAAPAPSAPQASGVVSEAELQAYRDILAADPKNARAAVQLGNKLYDAGRYAEAIPYYQQALAIEKDVNVSTDLATAMFYSGRTDEALAQLDRSLAIDPRHGQTLFNVGIVKRDGKKDKKGAVEAWERLLASDPTYPDAARVRTLIAESR